MSRRQVSGIIVLVMGMIVGGCGSRQSAPILDTAKEKSVTLHSTESTESETAYEIQNRVENQKGPGPLIEVSVESEITDQAGLDGAWPQWFGPHRDGISPETELLTEWPDEGPEMLWKVPGGPGFSALSVVHERLYTMVEESGVARAICINTENGERVWSVQVGDAFPGKGYEGPRSTPTVDEDRVYCMSPQGDLWCLQTDTGETIWHRNVLKDFETENIIWGLSASPLIEANMLLVNVGGPGASIVAFDKMNGAVIWQAHNDVASYASPIAINVGSVREIVFYAGKSLFGIGPLDGQRHWRFDWETTHDMNIATPLYDPETHLLFVSASRDTGRCSAYRLNEKNGTILAEHVYTSKVMKNHFNGCVLLDGYLYGFDNTILKCLRLEDGQEMWADRSVGKGSLIAADGHLFLIGEQGVAGVAEASPEAYREKGRRKILEFKSWTPPSLAEGVLYLRDQQHITALNLRTDTP